MVRDENVNEMELTCNLLDKLVLRQLHLMEEKMNCELNIETSINNGSIHLAKSRYIMGQSSVSKERLPTECSAEFSASIKLNTIKEDNIKQLSVTKTDDGDVVNPLNWFGVLVPQNLHKAKNIFQSGINYVVECVNVQTQLLENIYNIEILKRHKNSIIGK